MYEDRRLFPVNNIFSGPFLLSFVDWLGKDNLMIISGLAASAVSFFVIAFAHRTVEIFSSMNNSFESFKLCHFNKK